jgi:NADH-quinone oxidoreductase subunit M
MTNSMLLTLLIFSPLLFAGLVGLVPKERPGLVRGLSLGLMAAHFAASLTLLVGWKMGSAELQFVEQVPWVPQLGISYFVGLDGISLWLFLMTSFLGPLVVLGSWTAIAEKTKGFHIALFVLMTSMLGSFAALDLILFYVFFELSLVPMYFMIGIWGGHRRIYATLKFFIYTMAGSVLMLLAIIYLMVEAKAQLGLPSVTADLLKIYQVEIPFVAGDWLSPQSLLFWAFAIAFGIKVPMWPVHTWLPDAHVEAPTPGSVMLAAVALKMGTYGFIRFAIPLFPEAASHYAWIFMVLGVVGIVYGALVAMVQPDIKKLVAYSSVSHMGYVVIGLFAMNPHGLSGGIYQMLNHGISTGALFLLVGMVYERTHSREIKKYGGLASAMPWFTIAFVIVTMSSIAVPMTNGFIGEFLILLGAFKANPAIAIIAVTGVVLGAVYMLWMVKRVFFGERGELVDDKAHPLHDINLREGMVLAPLIVLIFWMGLKPGHFLDYINPSVQHLVENKARYNLGVERQGSRRAEGHSDEHAPSRFASAGDSQ